MDRIADLELFLRALELGSISAAARSLDLSPAVGSQRVKRLEASLGVRLLHRTTRRLTPTPEGSVLADQGQALVADLAELAGQLRDAAADVSGTLRLTMPTAFGSKFISPLLPAFLRRHPRLELDVNLADQLVDLVGAGYDMALRIGELEDSSLVAKRLAGNRRVLCASPAYLAARGTPETPRDLAAHDCLLLTGDHRRQAPWRFRSRSGKESTVRVTGRIRSNQGDLLRDAAVAGLGIARHSLWHICDDLDAGRLTVVLPAYAVPASAIYAVMPERRLVPPRVRAFVEYLGEQLGDTPPWERAHAPR